MTKPETTSIKAVLEDSKKVLKDAEKKAGKTPVGGTPKKPQTDIQVFRSQLTNYEKLIQKMITEDTGLNKDKFMSVAENAVRKNPKLLEADRATLFGAILTSAELGLEPNTPAQLSYMIPYWNNDRGVTEVEFQIGYHGFTTLMYRHPRVKKIIAELVYKQDTFRRWIDDTMNWRFEFVPAEDGMRGERKGVFAVVHLEGTDPLFLYMGSDKIMEIKAMSKRPQTYDISNDPEGWMWKKAAIRQIAKLTPKGNAVLSNAVNIDGMMEAGASITVDQSGQVLITKQTKDKTSSEKLKIVFGDDSIEEAVIVPDEETG